jgi:hypothetical protein
MRGARSELFFHEVPRAALGLDIELCDILAQDADAQELDPA